MRLARRLTCIEKRSLDRWRDMLAIEHGSVVPRWKGGPRGFMRRSHSILNERISELIMDEEVATKATLHHVRNSRRNYGILKRLVDANTSPLHLIQLYDTWIDVELCEPFKHLVDCRIVLCTGVQADFNARTYPLETDRDALYAILFNDRIFELLADLGWIYRRAFEGFISDAAPGAHQRFACREVDLSHGSNEKFDLAVDIFFKRHALQLDLPPDDERWSRDSGHLGFILFECMKYFVIGHELAHIALGHLDGNVQRQVFNDSGSAVGQITEVERSYNEELDADAFGLRAALMIGNDNGYHPEAVNIAAVLFFMAVSWIDLYRRLESGTAEAESVSHPSVQRRLDRTLAEIEAANLRLPPEKSTSFSSLRQLDAEMRTRIEETFAVPIA